MRMRAKPRRDVTRVTSSLVGTSFIAGLFVKARPDRGRGRSISTHPASRSDRPHHPYSVGQGAAQNHLLASESSPTRQRRSARSGRVTRCGPRHAGVRNESPARLEAPREQRKPPPVASRSERCRAGRHARRKTWGSPSRTGPSGPSSSCGFALERPSKPRRGSLAAYAGTKAGRQAPVVKKTRSRNPLNLESGGADKPRPPAGLRTGHPPAARKGIS
jgi:hypothetical protein